MAVPERCPFLSGYRDCHRSQLQCAEWLQVPGLRGVTSRASLVAIVDCVVLAGLPTSILVLIEAIGAARRLLRP